MDVEADSRLRADAERNRGRITAAARHLFATQGLDVSMASVARAAGVGKATLARRFATQGDLIAAVFEDRMRAYVRATELALAESDPWQGFVHYIEGVCSMQAVDRGFADVLTTSFNGADLLEELRLKAYEGFLEVIERARSTGYLRADFVSEDLFVTLLANAAVVRATADVTESAWRRFLGYMLRAFATPDAPLPPLPPAPSSGDLEKAMSRVASVKM